MTEVTWSKRRTKHQNEYLHSPSLHLILSSAFLIDTYSDPSLFCHISSFLPFSPSPPDFFILVFLFFAGDAFLLPFFYFAPHAIKWWSRGTLMMIPCDACSLLNFTLLIIRMRQECVCNSCVHEKKSPDMNNECSRWQERRMCFCIYRCISFRCN